MHLDFQPEPRAVSQIHRRGKGSRETPQSVTSPGTLSACAVSNFLGLARRDAIIIYFGSHSTSAGHGGAEPSPRALVHIHAEGCPPRKPTLIANLLRCEPRIVFAIPRNYPSKFTTLGGQRERDVPEYEEKCCHETAPTKRTMYIIF